MPAGLSVNVTLLRVIAPFWVASSTWVSPLTSMVAADAGTAVMPLVATSARLVGPPVAEMLAGAPAKESESKRNTPICVPVSKCVSKPTVVSKAEGVEAPRRKLLGAPSPAALPR